MAAQRVVESPVVHQVTPLVRRHVDPEPPQGVALRVRLAHRPISLVAMRRVDGFLLKLANGAHIPSSPPADTIVKAAGKDLLNSAWRLGRMRALLNAFARLPETDRSSRLDAFAAAIKTLCDAAHQQGARVDVSLDGIRTALRKMQAQAGPAQVDAFASDLNSMFPIDHGLDTKHSVLSPVPPPAAESPRPASQGRRTRVVHSPANADRTNAQVVGLLLRVAQQAQPGDNKIGAHPVPLRRRSSTDGVDLKPQDHARTAQRLAGLIGKNPTPEWRHARLHALLQAFATTPRGDSPGERNAHARTFAEAVMTLCRAARDQGATDINLDVLGASIQPALVQFARDLEKPPVDCAGLIDKLLLDKMGLKPSPQARPRSATALLVPGEQLDHLDALLASASASVSVRAPDSKMRNGDIDFVLPALEQGLTALCRDVVSQAGQDTARAHLDAFMRRALNHAAYQIERNPSMSSELVRAMACAFVKVRAQGVQDSDALANGAASRPVIEFMTTLVDARPSLNRSDEWLYQGIRGLMEGFTHSPVGDPGLLNADAINLGKALLGACEKLSPRQAWFAFGGMSTVVQRVWPPDGKDVKSAPESASGYGKWVSIMLQHLQPSTMPSVNQALIVRAMAVLQGEVTSALLWSKFILEATQAQDKLSKHQKSPAWHRLKLLCMGYALSLGRLTFDQRQRMSARMLANQDTYPATYFANQPFSVGAMAVDQPGCLGSYIDKTSKEPWGPMFLHIHHRQIDISCGMVPEGGAGRGVASRSRVGGVPDEATFAQTRGTQAIFEEELAQIRLLNELLEPSSSSSSHLGEVCTAASLFKRDELRRPIRELARDLRSERLEGIAARAKIIEALLSFIRLAQTRFAATLGADQTKAMSQWLDVIERCMRARPLDEPLHQLAAQCRDHMPLERRPASRSSVELSLTSPGQGSTERPDLSLTLPSPGVLSMPSLFSPGPDSPGSPDFGELADASVSAPPPATSMTPDPKGHWWTPPPQ